LRELRDIRLRRGLSQADLSAKTGVAEFTISQIEAGKRANPRPSTLRKLAQALDVEVADLYGSPEHPLAEAPLSQGKLFNNGILEEEQRARWEAAVEEARRLREGGRARMEELIAAWRDKRDHRTLRGMGRLLDEAYDAEAALTHYLEEESTGRILLDQVPITEWEEVRKASRFYGALFEMVQSARLSVRRGSDAAAKRSAEAQPEASRHSVTEEAA
jgi:transcriptional regulator with XRE-family HTH domain